MIRFKCIYCGQKILAPDDGATKKGKCPKCNHLVVIPRTTKGRPAINADTPEQLQQVRETFAVLNVSGKIQGLSDEVVNLYGERPGWLIPTYDELALFLMSATFILLSATNTTMREQLHKRIIAANDPRLYLLSVIFLGGIVLSLYHVFTTREKTTFEKKVMLFFAVAVNAGTGIISGWYVIKSNNVHNWQLIFPLWNIINGILLLVMLRLKIIDEECISDRDATPTQIILGLLAVLIIFIFCNYVFKLYWAITFSICIIYAASFDKAFQNVFPGLTNIPMAEVAEQKTDEQREK